MTLNLEALRVHSFCTVGGVHAYAQEDATFAVGCLMEEAPTRRGPTCGTGDSCYKTCDSGCDQYPSE